MTVHRLARLSLISILIALLLSAPYLGDAGADICRYPEHLAASVANGAARLRHQFIAVDVWCRRWRVALGGLELLNNKEVKSNEIHILNPFDNLLIQRKRVKELFNFDYQVECYVPNKKRVFGYYTLPVLYGDKFVLRFDAKANRNTGVFTINGHWYENGFKPSEKFINLLNIKLKEFAIFCGCNSVNKFFKMKK